jgi:uncharacterized phage protein (TIGR01671 family)
MREIKFRGQRKFSGYTKKPFEWVYGDFYHSADGDACIDEWEVVEDTVSQYTGLKDKSGVEIYEEDVVRKVPEEWPSKLDSDPRTLEQYLHDMSSVYVVEYQVDRFALFTDRGYSDRLSPGQHGSLEVIGNIYENPELLK